MRGISMYDSSSVSTLFSSLGSSKSTGSGMFGINLSEYASIRSGSYGKLMRSYFSMDSTKSTSKSDDSTKNTIEDLATTTSTSKDSTKTLAAIESDAKELTVPRHCIPAVTTRCLQRIPGAATIRTRSTKQ